jgi:hypothetical protein
MQNNLVGMPAEADVRFLGYRLEVISHWDPSPRKTATAQAISQRLTSIARCALMRPDVTDLINLSCRLLDDLFSAGDQDPKQRDPLAEETARELLDLYS